MMTHYDRLVDSIVDKLYKQWQDGSKSTDWDEEKAKQDAQAILEIVEEFQKTRVSSQPVSYEDVTVALNYYDKISEDLGDKIWDEL
jgi:hypothetical protein